MKHEGRALRMAVLVLVLGGVVAPILAGLWETLRAGLGVLPAIGATRPSLDPWRQLLALPGFSTSLVLTLWTGFASTLLALALATGFCALVHGRMAPGVGARLLAPLLATPHAAMAIGVAFLIAPSGWIARVLSPWLTGWHLPPDLPTLHDPWGGALILGLLVKEVPFLLLVMLAALGQLPVAQHMAAGRALGYGRGVVWIKLIVPQMWPLIRLPVLIVLAFALSVVDVAILLGPSNPPTLAVAVTRWFTAPDTRLILPASAAASLQAVLVAAAIGLAWLAQRLAARLGRWWLRRGGRGVSAEPWLMVASGGTLALMALGFAALVALALWSVAWRWPFPAGLPESWSLALWANPSGGWAKAAAETALIGAASTALALALAIAWLEGEDRARRGTARWAGALIVLPLLVPQIGFLYGLNVVFLRAGLRPGHGTVIWAHLLFVFPYVMIALAAPWRALDRRLLHTAAALGAPPLRRLVSVKLPVLLAPILTAAAIGFGVSVAQYLPTLFLGAGRIATLTTEAVTLASGSDRRVVGAYAVLQAALPFAAYATALLLPSALHRNRLGLSGRARA
ncbi:ABC transporter permease [Phaeovulum sp.]|uniref:ABC transporter permease n=1 Tax=Phaeovulum sp. TaxID=2934796 RepID=UPI00272F0071|nr:ABC transporter permease subunit [Phaeovulum sp.]MDP1668994.1 ABC transporter permease subunit [Phaeovulum sp.]MDZ4117963.1 ABC transporter permease subunit [Phaeovulum sp.]